MISLRGKSVLPKAGGPESLTERCLHLNEQISEAEITLSEWTRRFDYATTVEENSAARRECDFLATRLKALRRELHEANVARLTRDIEAAQSVMLRENEKVSELGGRLKAADLELRNLEREHRTAVNRSSQASRIVQRHSQSLRDLVKPS